MSKSWPLYHMRSGNEIRIRQISAVQYRPPAFRANGFLQVSFIGGQESKGTSVHSARFDENSAMFNKRQEPQFARLKAQLDRLMTAVQDGAAPAAQPARRISSRSWARCRNLG